MSNWAVHLPLGKVPLFSFAILFSFTTLSSATLFSCATLFSFNIPSTTDPCLSPSSFATHTLLSILLLSLSQKKVNEHCLSSLSLTTSPSCHCHFLRPHRPYFLCRSYCCHSSLSSCSYVRLPALLLYLLRTLILVVVCP